MANIGSLVVDLQANSAAFLQEMQRARAATERMAQGVQQSTQLIGRAFQTAGNLARSFIGALSVGAITAFISQSVNMAGGLGEAAQQLGLTTDALQAMRFAVVQDGLSIEQFDGAMLKFNDTIGSARRGVAEAIQSFDRLGVKILDANGQVRPSVDVFQDVAEAISRLPSAAQQAAAAGDVFGARVGGRLLPLIQRLATDGFGPLMEAARAAGAIIGTDVIDAADRASDAYARNQMVLQAWGATIGTWAVNRVGEFLTALGQLVALFNQVWEAMQGPAALRRLMGDPIQTLRDQIVGLEQDLVRAQEALRQLDAIPAHQRTRGTPGVQSWESRRIDAMMRLWEANSRLATARGDLNAQMGNGGGDVYGPPRPPPRTVGARNPTATGDARGMAQVLEDLQRQFDALSGPNAERQTFIDAWVRKLPDAARGTGLMADRVRDMSGALYDGQQRQRALNDAFEDGTRISEQMMTQQERLQDQLANLNYLRDVGAISQTTYNRAVSDAWLKTGSLGEAVGSLGDAFSSAFESAIVKGESLRNVLGNLLADIGRLLVRLAVLEPIKQAITQGLGSLFGGSGTGAGGGGGHGFATGGIMTARGPVPLRSYAGGGIASSPQVAIFGEGSMDEAYVPLPDGKAIPVQMRGGGRGGHTFVTQVDARGSDAGVLIRVQAMLEQRDARLLAAIPQMSRDGGGFARSVGARKR